MDRLNIVFCDIDGTLLDENHPISAGMIQKVQALERLGIPFVLVSARPPGGVLRIRDQLGIKAPIIGLNSAIILDGDGSVLEEFTIGADEAMALEQSVTADWPDMYVNIYTRNDWIVHHTQTDWLDREISLIGQEPSVGDLPAALNGTTGIHKIMFVGKPGRIVALQEVLRERYKNLSINRSNDMHLDVVHGAVNKGVGVQTICERFNIPLSSAISFGDSFGDVDMLRLTGRGYAMGNANEAVKSQASHIAPPIEEDGVLTVLNDLFA